MRVLGLMCRKERIVLKLLICIMVNRIFRLEIDDVLELRVLLYGIFEFNKLVVR